MVFSFNPEDLRVPGDGEERCWLLTNGLGGYASTSAVFSVTRCDQGLLIGSLEAPCRRFSLVHRLSERLSLGSEQTFLSAQTFADSAPAEDGWRNLTRFAVDAWPEWEYAWKDIRVLRCCVLEQGENTAAILYTVENSSPLPCTLEVIPQFQFVPKGEVPPRTMDFQWKENQVSAAGRTLYIRTSGTLMAQPVAEEHPVYPADERDGRVSSGRAFSCCAVSWTIQSGEKASLELVFSLQPAPPCGSELLNQRTQRLSALEERAGLRDPIARQLVRNADAFLSRRDSTGQDTIIAGYPFFGDWGRDTMISLPGCLLSTRRYDEAKRIMRTFLHYEKDGLVPNMFPESGEQPWYNTVDASLLLFLCLWQYWLRTGDRDFVQEAWPALIRIAEAYQRGTHYGIHMDEDGLICAGSGLEQLTWMDVRIDDFLPTPRHGKPVEINAYWYNALCILSRLAPVVGESDEPWSSLAQRVKKSFRQAFWMEREGYLKDVISGTAADRQIRCNQIWAVSVPFSLLTPEQEQRVVDTVYRHLYTSRGLRTLSPEDPDFHPSYGGPQRERDLAYHQGTVWPFPLGAWYLAYWKVHGGSREAEKKIRTMLRPMEEILREGCIGQLPEIYDGLEPGPSRGCFAQAWSVGELLRVYETLERGERRDLL